MQYNETNQEPSVCGNCCLRLENVSVTLGGNSILNNINLHIHCGQMAVVIGPNGAGKTTLFKAILGEVPFSGEINNQLSSVKGTRSLKIGYVPQRLNFDSTSPVTVMDLFAACLSSWPLWLGHRNWVKKVTVEALARVNAEDCLKKRLGTLSGGQLQRVLLALALNPVPDLLLLDEPVSGVDPAGIELFYRMVSELRRTYHLAIVLVSHDCAVAARYADRMVFINKTVFSDGKPIDVLRSDAVIKTFGHLDFSGLAPVEFPLPVCHITGNEV
jgi:zinc transport system ATP-binding protein